MEKLFAQIIQIFILFLFILFICAVRIRSIYNHFILDLTRIVEFALISFISACYLIKELIYKLWGGDTDRK